MGGWGNLIRCSASAWRRRALWWNFAGSLTEGRKLSRQKMLLKLRHVTQHGCFTQARRKGAGGGRREQAGVAARHNGLLCGGDVGQRACLHTCYTSEWTCVRPKKASAFSALIHSWQRVSRDLPKTFSRISQTCSRMLQTVARISPKTSARSYQ